jgi:hypothetical protein
MSYTAFAKAGYEVPAKFGYFLLGWALVQTKLYKPPTGFREISLEEWDATPRDLLVHPDMHPEKFAKVPGDKQISDKRAELFHKAGRPDVNPSSPAAHGH